MRENGAAVNAALFISRQFCFTSAAYACCYTRSVGGSRRGRISRRFAATSATSQISVDQIKPANATRRLALAVTIAVVTHAKE